MNEEVNISITGEENSKSEVVYNNVIKNMKLTKEEQVEYLKQKVTYLELQMKNRNIALILLLISLIGMGFGIFLVISDLYLLGIFFIFATFFYVAYRLYKIYKVTIKTVQNRDFDKVEELRQMLNIKLK